FFFQAEDGIRDGHVTGVQTCALPICERLYPPPPSPLPRLRPPANSLGGPRSAGGSRPGLSDGSSRHPIRTISPLRTFGRNTIREIGRASCRERVETGDGAAALTDRTS